jgi:hypothetical protein
MEISKGRTEGRKRHLHTFYGKDKLVNDDVVCVDLIRRELLHKSLRLIERKKLRNADADERRLVLKESSANSAKVIIYSREENKPDL